MILRNQGFPREIGEEGWVVLTQISSGKYRKFSHCNPNHMKTPFLFFLAWFSALALSAQNYEATAIAHPVAPGERLLSFDLHGLNANNYQNDEVYVFYATQPTALNTLSLNGTTPYGKVVLMRTGSQVRGHFVFPHLSQPQPNRRYWEVLRTQNTQGLQTNFLAGRVNWRPQVIDKDECVYFRVAVRAGNEVVSASETGRFRMPDSYNIGLVGDSYGSGEGAPDVESPENPQWAYEPCHRSNNSGLVRGVLRYISLHPEIAVDVEHAACSGASTIHLGSNSQMTDWTFTDGGSQINPLQFQTLTEELIDNRGHDQIHLLIMSIGGNDVGFGDVVINYFIMPQNMEQASFNDPSVLADIQTEISNLGTNYDNLHQEILSDLGPIKPRIGICTYPDPTSGPDGLCGFPDNPFELASLDPELLDPSNSWCLLESDVWNQPQSEYRFLRDEFIRPLNAKIREKSGDLNWGLIDVEEGMRRHGLCNCTEPYINTILASMAIQGHVWGVAHPNRAGYDAVYTMPVFDFIEESVEQYRANYALGILFGLVEVAPCPEGLASFQLLPALIAMQALIDNPFQLKKHKQLQLLARDKEVRMAIAKNDLKALKAQPSYRQFEASMARQKGQIAEDLIPRKPSRKMIRPIKPSPWLKKMDLMAEKQLQSRELQSVMEAGLEIVKKYNKTPRQKQPVRRKR